MGRRKTKPDVSGWEEEILAIYADGGSDAEVKMLIRQKRGTFGPRLWYRWLDEEPEFAAVIELGREMAEAWWNRMGRLGAVGREAVNPALWIFTMKNRFGWKDAKDIQHSGSVEFSGLAAVYGSESENVSAPAEDTATRH